MAGQLFFVISLTICSSWVNGHDLDTCTVTFSPDIAQLEPIPLMESFAVGDSMWFAGRIFANPSAPPCTPPTTTSTTPLTPTTPATGTTTSPTPTPPATGTTTSPTPTPPATGTTTPLTPPANVENKCSFLTYTPEECKGMRLLVSRLEDGCISLRQATYNEKLNTVALFETTLKADAEKAIFSQSFGFYGTLDEGGKVSITECTPPEIKEAQSAELVVIGMGAKKEWAVVTSCNKSVVLVIYNMEFVADDKAAEPFTAEIDELITKIQVTPDQVAPIPCEMKFKLDHFMMPPTELPAPQNPPVAQ